MASSTRRSPVRVQLDDAARRRAERTALAQNIRQAPAPQDSGGAPSPAAKNRGEGRGPFTGRLLLVLALLVGSVFLLAPQLKVFMTQRVEVSQLQGDIEEQKMENERLRAELKRYDDPAYVKQQARDRLFMVMPGETRYMVAGTLPGDDQPLTGTAASRAEKPWHQSYLDAVRQAAR